MIYDWLKNVSKTGNTENQTKWNFSHKYRKCILKIIFKEENDKEFTVIIYFLQLKIFLLYWKMFSTINDFKHEGRKYPLCRHSLYNRIRKERGKGAEPPGQLWEQRAPTSSDFRARCCHSRKYPAVSISKVTTLKWEFIYIKVRYLQY